MGAGSSSVCVASPQWTKSRRARAALGATSASKLDAVDDVAARAHGLAELAAAGADVEDPLARADVAEHAEVGLFQVGGAHGLHVRCWGRKGPLLFSAKSFIARKP